MNAAMLVTKGMEGMAYWEGERGREGIFPSRILVRMLKEREGKGRDFFPPEYVC